MLSLDGWTVVYFVDWPGTVRPHFMKGTLVKRKLISVLCTLAIVLSFPSSALAYYHQYPGWSTNSDGIGDGDLDVCFEPGTFSSASKTALTTGYAELWGDTVMTHIALTNNGETCPSGDNIEVRLDPLPCGIVAQTQDLNTLAPDTYMKIVFNSGCGIQWDFGTAPPVNNGQYSAQSVWLHEIGHTLGLGHTPLSNKVMTPGYCILGFQATGLSQDDASGAQTWYPAYSRGGSFPTNAPCAT